ncbi:MAG: tRNA 2-thiouridine(34) synthase MnmA [Coriobacteriia bacterium]|nr:tRNA 2-thiouridine(34) synthase MnmA [Coriobacteriia bacterium]
MPRILVAMSGGVDSSVAALLLLQAGNDCEGVTLRLHDDTAAEDDAAAVCDLLGIRHHIWDMTALFRRTVVDPFVAGYKRGETPNPCIDCNREIKFGALLAQARAEGFDALATGHYARIGRDAETDTEHAAASATTTSSEPPPYRLYKASDPAKDQSYVLFQLGQNELAYLRFPLGDLSKQQVYGLAAAAGLPSADRPESQDICFIPNDDYRSFLRRHDGQAMETVQSAQSAQSGEIVDSDGRLLGYHTGITDYTIGQRRGLGVAVGHPLYVIGIDVASNRIIVGEEQQLYCRKALLRGFSAPIPQDLEPVMEVSAKYRYRSAAAAARLVMFDDGRWELQFYEPQKALTPGQACVCYQADQVVAGGIIDKVRK